MTLYISGNEKKEYENNNKLFDGFVGTLMLLDQQIVAKMWRVLIIGRLLPICTSETGCAILGIKTPKLSFKSTIVIGN